MQDHGSAIRTSSNAAVLSFYRDAGIEPRVGMEARELQTALGLVASGGGVCIMPASANNLQQSWRFDWEPPKAVLRDVRTIDWILGG
jgi:DNA-binding transcriptional LysR family regulator